MFAWLFPHWSSPTTIAALVVGLAVVDGGLVALVARASGKRTLSAAVAASLAGLSVLIAVWILRVPAPRHLLTWVELGCHAGLVVLAGAVVARDRSLVRLTTFGLLLVGALVLGGFRIVAYGEATVAP